ncbi:MAG: two-component system response regulator [Anaerolineae bacterium CG_4_9_14_3_um_filter_57_17]|nr:response regulator [bacterium]NCT20312.1 response regulator [bacterium]OIO84791.1 MAG: two-component system response regulator [Anaerolineae bacterium CG2_30_57_67]PJB64723.1 MAG: two-component system response regulator [Anaerolineae bacterium CG_4_9_14_3_um_filter_57_17]
MNHPAHILLVEDNRMDVELTLDAFKEARLENKIHVASNGQEALDYLFGRGKYSDRKTYPTPNLILLDLKLPGVDGFEVLRQVKSTPVLKRIPVVILTSSKDEGDRALSYDIGANSYLVKPVSFEGFLGVVREINGYWLSLNISPPENHL